MLSKLQLPLLIFALSACANLTSERLVYDQQGIRVGIQADPTVYRSSPPALNSHPAQWSPDEVRVMLGALHVSGWSGTLVGIFASPRPILLFKEEELTAISGPLAAALRQAGSDERVFFSLPNKEAPYDDRTEGALFVRSPYLHIVVTDHSAFTRADTGGGEEKDLRDTKGMKLWVAGPARAAVVTANEEPRWAPFETVHISINSAEVLAMRRATSPVRIGQAMNQPPADLLSQEISKVGSASGVMADTSEDLRLQIRELTSSNLELRARLDEQIKQMKELKEELARLQQELDKSKSKTPTLRKPPAP